MNYNIARAKRKKECEMYRSSPVKGQRLDMMAFGKYISALLLFGLNGIVASHIALSSYEIVFLRTMIGSMLLIVLFVLGKGKFNPKEPYGSI